ncbi:MAG: hypothetical protein AAF682_26530 [Planctomycetota bacterium]
MTRLFLAPLLALAAPATAQTIWTVNNELPADFTEIGDAIDAASDGDTILVYATKQPYTFLWVEGKSLTVQGVGRPSVSGFPLFPLPAVRVVNLAPGQDVQVRGFDVGGTSSIPTVAVEANACQAAVVFEDLDVAGSGVPLLARECTSVTATRCVLQSPLTTPVETLSKPTELQTHPALLAVASSVFVYDSTLNGSDGNQSVFGLFGNIQPGPGGPGALLRGSTMFASGSTFSGGDGGSDTPGLCFAGGDAGTGMTLDLLDGGAGSQAWLLDCVATGGVGGLGGCGLGDGTDADDIVLPGGQIFPLAGSARTLAIASPVLDGGLLEVDATGEPGDVVVAFVGGPTLGLFVETLQLSLHLAAPVQVVPLGTVAADGTLSISQPAPTVAAGGFVELLAQALFVSPDGLFETGPTSLLFLGAGF